MTPPFALSALRMEGLHVTSSPSVHAKGASLLDSAVALTRDTERAALHAGLLRTLGEMLPLREVRLAERGELAPGAPAIGGGSWHLLPLRGPDAPHGKEIAVHLGSDSAEDVSVLHGFLRLYRNFLAVIEESERDRLTQLRNRRAFDLRLDGLSAQLIRSRRHATADNAYWLALIDIDHFKSINDRYGHLYGDEVLILLAQLLRQHFGEHHDAYRYGGEEFAALISARSDKGARQLLERFRAAVEGTEFPGVKQVTVSIGYAPLEPGKAPPVIIERADRALYEAKGRGRNRVVDVNALLGPAANPDHGPREWGDIELF
ncbi:MAG: GGDEF domain-containing protein [Algiphilus sp.]|uniref:GGDEF domain-containing protein n=1 Tax=Algiphilus sp. TaxID=1872431 RepID=UPI0032EDC87F